MVYLNCLVDGRLNLCVSNEILFEYQEVFARKTNEVVAENVVNFIAISPFTIRTDIYFNFGMIFADPSDNKFADCSITANADFIVSNDKHFQVLKTIEFPKVRVLTLAEFEGHYKSNLMDALD